MKEKESPLHSPYVIDGVRQDLSPAQILAGVLDDVPAPEDGVAYAPVVDETVDTDPVSPELDRRKVEKYYEAVSGITRVFPIPFADCFTRTLIYKSLLDCIWRLGHFRIGDLALEAAWHWNKDTVGNMAGFYNSVSAMGELLYALNLKLQAVSVTSSKKAPRLEVTADLGARNDEVDLVVEPYTTEAPRIGAASIPNAFQPDAKSWIVYIPFDSSAYRLGGSLLAQALGVNPPQAPALDDSDYFIDCYEAVRELVEDGIVLAGATVGEGGLISALKEMATMRTGAVLDISDLKKAAADTDIVNLLFAEVPGVVIQIRDIDFDYIDAELLLQDVAFYPLGHPAQNGGAVRVRASVKTGIQSILESLVQRQCGEGED